MSHAESWLPEGKRAAVVWTIDDLHPGTSRDPYEAGGDLGAGALGHVEWLLERHQDLRVTLFTTPDWREIKPLPTRRLLARIPWLRDRVFLTGVHPRGTMRLDRHPGFVAYLKSLPRTEIAGHGLHHVHKGLSVPVEFQDESASWCGATLREANAIFAAAGLDRPRGMTPPGWNLPPALEEALVQEGFSYVASARDILTPITVEARTNMSGLRGVSLLQPELIAGGRLVHLPTNFQATSEFDRAVAVVEAGGLLSVKAHIVKQAFGHVALDGMDSLYRNYLDVVFSALEDRYGTELWWTTMADVADRVLRSKAEAEQAA